MVKEWNQERIEQEFICAQAEESTTIEYKAAGALSKESRKKDEITRDVSALANAAGGLIFYGVKEYDEKVNKHLPERLDPIDRVAYPKEWIEQVVNNIRPRIDGLIIHPVSVHTDTISDGVVYVVEVPRSTTAHQATDLRYYRRYNFQRLAMQDHEVRDVMNRGAKPDAEVKFFEKYDSRETWGHKYKLGITVENQGLLVINHFKLEFAFPDLDQMPLQDVSASGVGNIDRSSRIEVEERDSVAISVKRAGGFVRVIYRSQDILFPKDKRSIDEDFVLKYWVNDQVYFTRGRIPALEWILYADNMSPKQGSIPFTRFCAKY